MIKNPFRKSAQKAKKNLAIDKKMLKDFLGENNAQESGVILLVVLISFALAYFVLKPINISYRLAKINIEDLKKEKEILTEKKMKLDSLGQELEANADFIKQVEDVLPKDSQIPEILVSLEKYANENSLYITNFLPRPKTKEEIAAEATGQTTGEGLQAALSAWETVELQFDLTGSYLSMKNFIGELEKNYRTIDIKNITVTGGGEITPAATSPLRFNVRAYVYYQD